MDSPVFVAGTGASVSGDKCKTDISPAASKYPTERGRTAVKNNTEEVLQLPKSLGFISGFAFVAGSVIGSGIFISPKWILRSSGSVGASLLVWAGCGLFSALCSICFVELGLMYPAAGGEFVYFFGGLGPLHSFWGPLPAFLFAWTTVLVVRPTSCAVISMAAAEYAVQPFFTDHCQPPQAALKLVAVLFLLSFTAACCYSSELGALLQTSFTAAKLSVILMISVVGICWLAVVNSQHLNTGFRGSSPSLGQLATAFYGGLWAYGGWNNLNYLIEELVEPARNLPRCILAGMGVVTASYLVANVSYLAVMSAEDLMQSPAVAVTFADRALGPFALVVPVGVVLSVLGTLNGSVFTSGRITLAAARRGHTASVLSHINIGSRTPLPALVSNALLSTVVIAVGSIEALILVNGFTEWIVNSGIMVTLLVLRWTRPDAPRPFRVPLLVPVLVLLVSLGLVLAPVLEAPQVGYFFVLAFMAVGCLVYVPFVFFGLSPDIVDDASKCIQKLLMVVPSTTAS